MIKLEAKREVFFVALLLMAITALSLTYIIEYIGGVMGCPLCIYERFPYLLIIAFSIYALASSRYDMSYIFSSILVGVVISLYHAGVERGFFASSGLCKPAVSITKNLSLVELQAILSYQTAPSCDKVSFSVFGLSLTEWNLLLNLALIILIFYVVRNAKT